MCDALLITFKITPPDSPTSCTMRTLLYQRMEIPTPSVSRRAFVRACVNNFGIDKEKIEFEAFGCGTDLLIHIQSELVRIEWTRSTFLPNGAHVPLLCKVAAGAPAQSFDDAFVDCDTLRLQQ